MNPPNRILRTKEVCARIGFSRTKLWAMARAGSFPASLSTGTRSIGWLEADVERWIAERVKESRGGAQAGRDRKPRDAAARDHARQAENRAA